MAACALRSYFSSDFRKVRATEPWVLVPIPGWHIASKDRDEDHNMGFGAALMIVPVSAL